jgi:hypothetical protein
VTPAESSSFKLSKNAGMTPESVGLQGPKNGWMSFEEGQGEKGAS